MPKRPQISVKKETYDKLKEAAKRNGEQVGTLVDALVRDYLARKAKGGPIQ
jgi:hypothetical protein